MAKNVEIQKVVVRGFGTFVEEFVFDMDRGGVNIIRGKNGAGKTTLFSALVWCLYQINLKGSKNDAVATWKSARNKDYKGTRVVVTMLVDGVKYAIARHIKYTGNTYGVPGESDLLIFKENTEGELTKGCLISDVRGKSESQGLVDKLLGVDSRTFMNSVMFPQRSRRFIESDNTEKRRLLEELFDLGFVDRMKDKADDMVKKLQLAMSEDTNDRERADIRAKGILERVEDAKRNLREWEKQAEEAIAELEEEAKALQVEHDEGERKLKQANTVMKKLGDSVGDPDAIRENNRKVSAAYKDALDLSSAAKVHIDNLNREISRAEDSIKDKELSIEEVRTVCPTCGSKLKKEQIDQAKDNLKKEVSKMKTGRKALQDALKIAVTRSHELQEALDVAEKMRDRIQHEGNEKLVKYTEASQVSKTLTTELVNLRGRHDKILSFIQRNKSGEGKPSVDIPALEQEAEELLATVVECDANLLKLGKRLKRYEWWKTVGLGSKGLKAYVFSAMLEQLNSYIVKYANRMGLGVQFSVDLTKASMPFVTECYKDGEMVDYADLSGGEKQRIDIAMLFAMHDLVSGIVSFNVLIMDEVFEGLDQEGMEQAFDLIRMKGGEEITVYVITHSTRVDTLHCHKLEVVKTNGQSILQTAA